MADINLRIKPQGFDNVEKRLKEIEKDRVINLTIADKNGIQSLLTNLEKLERVAKAADAAMDNFGSNSGNLSKLKTNLTEIWKLQEKVSKASSKFSAALTGTDKHLMPTAAYREREAKFKTISKELSALENKAQLGPLTTDDLIKLNDLSKQFETARIEADKYKAGVDSAVKSTKNLTNEKIAYDKLGSKITDYGEKYSTQLSKNVDLQNKLNKLLYKTNKGQFASVQDANREWAAFRVEARKAGIEVETFGTKLQKAFGSKLRSQLSSYGIMGIELALRDIVRNAIEVDTAMTELKKVTSETDTVYTQFLEGAEQRAQRLGATLSEVVNATADYARLGYNIDQATTLADSALIYSNVGDDVQGIDDATGALISTMQGFNIAAADSMSIVDKFNNVSNNYASSAGDIGEIVRRSAASMSAAGNSLDQTIALGVAANEVQQDA